MLSWLLKDRFVLNFRLVFLVVFVGNEKKFVVIVLGWLLLIRKLFCLMLKSVMFSELWIDCVI